MYYFEIISTDSHGKRHIHHSDLFSFFKNCHELRAAFIRRHQLLQNEIISAKIRVINAK